MTTNIWVRRLLTVLAVWAAWALITTFVVQPFAIPSGSMENTLAVGDRVIVNKTATKVRRGDVVVFADSSGWEDAPPAGLGTTVRSALAAVHLTASGTHLVKRVIGLPGDHVVCKGPGSKVTVNGMTIDEHYLKPGSDPCDDAYDQGRFDITVPAGHMWVMGDNRQNSADSRAHDNGSGGRLGSVPLSDITGTVISVVWPVTSWSLDHNDESSFRAVRNPH